MLYGSNTSAYLFGMLIVSLVVVQHCVGLCLSGTDGMLLCVCGSDLLVVLLYSILLVTYDYKSCCVVCAP